MKQKEGYEDSNEVQRVPRGLRLWFVIHFAVDMIVAIPLFVAPYVILNYFGWQEVDILSTRLFAAALFGIGLESFLGRNANSDIFKSMLTLKIIWSSFASLGIALAIIHGSFYNNILTWIGLVVFVCFNGLWLYWKWYLKHN